MRTKSSAVTILLRSDDDSRFAMSQITGWSLAERFIHASLREGDIWISVFARRAWSSQEPGLQICALIYISVTKMKLRLAWNGPTKRALCASRLESIFTRRVSCPREWNGTFCSYCHSNFVRTLSLPSTSRFQLFAGIYCSSTCIPCEELSTRTLPLHCRIALR